MVLQGLHVKLWDTENGDDDFDEINLIQDKFNSGWETQKANGER